MWYLVYWSPTEIWKHWGETIYGPSRALGLKHPCIGLGWLGICSNWGSLQQSPSGPHPKVRIGWGPLAVLGQKLLHCPGGQYPQKDIKGWRITPTFPKHKHLIKDIYWKQKCAGFIAPEETNLWENTYLRNFVKNPHKAPGTTYLWGIAMFGIPIQAWGKLEQQWFSSSKGQACGFRNGWRPAGSWSNISAILSPKATV